MGEGTKALIASVVLTGLIFGVGALWGANRRAERLDRGPGELKDVFLAQGKEPLWSPWRPLSSRARTPMRPSGG